MTRLFKQGEFERSMRETLLSAKRSSSGFYLALVSFLGNSDTPFDMVAFDEVFPSKPQWSKALRDAMYRLAVDDELEDKEISFNSTFTKFKIICYDKRKSVCERR
jgi:hypothetical protein